ncbi:hypothetical protein [Streptomyces griseus]|uniref:hypothetical protein n=1 Tax=Streptomyces griseus TaxID=1911 RepID=UPI0033EC954F
MASLGEIRDALATAICDGVDTELMEYPEVPDVIRLPAIVVRPTVGDFTGAFQRGLDTWEFDVFVLVRRQEGPTQQELLDQFISGNGPNSIRRAVYENSDLGLGDQGVYDAMVKKMVGYGGTFQVAHMPHTGAILKVTVQADGAS